MVTNFDKLHSAKNFIKFFYYISLSVLPPILIYKASTVGVNFETMGVVSTIFVLLLQYGVINPNLDENWGLKFAAPLLTAIILFFLVGSFFLFLIGSEAEQIHKSIVLFISIIVVTFPTAILFSKLFSKLTKK